MCTVTFLPLKDRVLITSNRDEHVLRAPAALPEAVRTEHGNILFPRDGQAGGTWIALHSNGNAMVLLNGAWKRHEHQPPYRKSRGLIFLDIFNTATPSDTFSDIELDGIEPFTLVIWEHNSLTETRWDGTRKYLTRLPADVPRIWSSATLYDEEVIALRKRWFADWLAATTVKNAETIRRFHEWGGNGDETIALKMNRNGLLQTVSITGMEIGTSKAAMYYRDINAGLVSINEWQFEK